MNKNTLIKIASYFGIIFLFLTSLFYFLNLDNFIIITSNSMDPKIKIGDMVYYNSLDRNDYVEGDIVVIKGPIYYYEHGVDPSIFNYLNNNTPIIHRIVNINYNEIENIFYFETKGDNNQYSDGCLKGVLDSNYGTYVLNLSDPILIPETEIIGKVNIIIPFIGYIGLNFSKILITIIIFAIILYVIQITGYKIDLKIRLIKL